MRNQVQVALPLPLVASAGRGIQWLGTVDPAGYSFHVMNDAIGVAYEHALPRPDRVHSIAVQDH